MEPQTVLNQWVGLVAAGVAVLLLAGWLAAYVLGREEVRIEVYVDGKGEWRWRAVARNNRVVADSGEGYASRGNVLRAIRAFKAGFATAKVVDVA